MRSPCYLVGKRDGERQVVDKEHSNIVRQSRLRDSILFFPSPNVDLSADYTKLQMLPSPQAAVDLVTSRIQVAKGVFGPSKTAQVGQAQGEGKAGICSAQLSGGCPGITARTTRYLAPLSRGCLGAASVSASLSLSAMHTLAAANFGSQRHSAGVTHPLEMCPTASGTGP